MASRLAVRGGLPYVFALVSLVYADDLTPPAQYEGKPVAGIRFDPATQPVATPELNKLVGGMQGKPLHLSDIRTALKQLYGTGEYSSLEVDTETAPSGVTLVFHTASQWFVGPVEVRGKISNPPNSGQLADAARLDLGAPLKDGDIALAVQNVKSLLERNGLYRSTVTPQVVRDPVHEQVAVTFQVNSGKRARLTLPKITGDPKMPADDVAHAAKYKEILFFPWKLATQANVQSGIDKIRSKYEKQERLTATIALDRTDLLPSYRVQPTIHVEGGPKVKLTAEGAKVSGSVMNRYVPVFDEGTVNEDLLVAGARNLRDYFQNRGYFDVEVDYSSKQTNADLQTITYTISLGEVHRLIRLDIKGNKYFTADQIRERMYLQAKGWLRLRHGRYSESFASRDEDTIKALYQDNGFQDCQVSTVLKDDFQGKKGDVAITMNITEGPQYLVSNLEVKGMNLKNRDALISTLQIQHGQPYSETGVAADRDTIIEAYQTQGYASAQFDYHTAPAGLHQMSVQYTITEGPQQTVRDVLITGLRTSRHRLIDPLISLHAGDSLSWTEMGNMQRRLYNLGVFEKVDMAIQNPDGTDEHKYIDFHCVEGHLYTIGVGLGAEITKIGGSATSVSNPNGVTGFAPRFELQLSRLNMWGLGHTVNFDGRYSTLDRRVSLIYAAPRFRNVDGRNITVTALYDNTRDILTFTAVKYQGVAQVSQRLSKATNLLFRYSWTDDRIDSGSLKINPLLIPLYSQPSRVASFGANLVQDRRDDPSDAHHGIYNSLDVAFASHDFGGNRNFLRFLGRNSYYKQLPKSLVLASNTEFGMILPMSTGGISTTTYIPLPERFFSGGESSIRAFAMNQAGPRDLETGFPLGGDALFYHSTELRFPFIGDNIDGVLFHDMGNVYTSLGAVSFRVHQKDLQDFDYMVHAAGFGIRYRTPLGPLRVDLAYAINSPTYYGLQGTYDQLLFGGATKTVQNSGHFQFFFSIGQAF